MAIKSYKSTTNGRRGMTTLDNSELTKVAPEKSLLVTLKKNGGRNNQGRITVRHQGGGAKRKYRIIAWRIPWTEEPYGLQSIRLQTVGHD